MVNSICKEYIVLGLMSGTSLDGLDLALSRFCFNGYHWNYRIEKAETVNYSSKMRQVLKHAPECSAEQLVWLDHDYGKWIARNCNRFLKDTLKPVVIASHGHTVFHQPANNFSHQIGNGNEIAAITQLPVVYDFRSMDVALGGQGAPLVPAGDEYLFGNYSYCLNLGGFSNISSRLSGKRIAFDICPVNIALNDVSLIMGKNYDSNGIMGRKGEVMKELLEKLNSIGFYNISPPRSLGREWYEKEFKKCIDNSGRPVDILRTIYEHITDQIVKFTNRSKGHNILVTGGGAKNLFLTELLIQKSVNQMIIPEEIIVDYKEAMVFAFLGLLRLRNEINCFRSVTGAKSDSSTGVLVYPPPNSLNGNR